MAPLVGTIIASAFWSDIYSGQNGFYGGKCTIIKSRCETRFQYRGTHRFTESIVLKGDRVYDIHYRRGKYAKFGGAICINQLHSHLRCRLYMYTRDSL